jgi:hypothetical protein
VAKEDRNYVGIRFLDWFVEEQLEEVTSMNDLLAAIRRAGPDRLLFVEEYLSVRDGPGWRARRLQARSLSKVPRAARQDKTSA